MTHHNAQHAAPPVATLDQLAARHPRLVHAIEASSPRGDVRERRARIVLLLLRMRCPLHGAPAKGWYVPGGVARLGAAGLRRCWAQEYGEAPVSLRSMRAHLAALERVLVLVRRPGDWMPVLFDPEHPERRPRHPDTFELLLDEQEARWWSERGAELLAQNPKTRTSPTAWRAVFGTWRREAKATQLCFPFGGFGGFLTRPEQKAPDQRLQARRIARAAAMPGDVLDLLVALRDAGVGLRGRPSFVLAGDPARLRGAAALLSRALERGDRIRSLSGWLVAAWNRAAPEELAGALRQLFRARGPAT